MSEETKKPVYMKNWFLFVMLLFFFPIGAILLYIRRNEFEKNTRIAMAVGFGLFFIFSMMNHPSIKDTDTEKPVQKSVQTTQAKPVNEDSKQAFLMFNQKIMDAAGKADALWKSRWVDGMTAMSNGTMDRFAAYNNIQMLYNQLEPIWYSVSDNTPPQGLTESQKDTLEDAVSEYQTSLYLKREACEKLMDMIDKDSSSTKGINEINDKLNQSNSLMISSMAKLASVGKELGVADKMMNK